MQVMEAEDVIANDKVVSVWMGRVGVHWFVCEKHLIECGLVCVAAQVCIC